MTNTKIEPVVTVGLRRSSQTSLQFTYQMDELSRLVETANGRVVQSFTQTRAHPDPGTLIGKGKLAALAEEVQKLGIKTIVFDDDLTAAQQKNIEKIVKGKVIDRTRLILDIFAKRARSREGQLQVELAQLNYLVPRLTGAWRGFSQQMGGIGTRGPGEKKIEVERRYVRVRIKHLKKQIDDLRQHRERARIHRQGVPIPQIALVGYTNVGKSSLLNTLVGKKDHSIYADDLLFATLDPTTRRVKLPGGQWVLFTDTVGFIEKLPPLLTAAFRATLEEVTQSTLLVHVVDLAAPNRQEQEKSVVETIKDLGGGHIPMITIYNKSDLLSAAQKARLMELGKQLLSCKKRSGISEFLSTVETKLDELLLDVTFNLPYQSRHLLSTIYKSGHIVSEEPNAQGTHLRIRIDPANWKKISHELKHEKENI